MADRDVKEDADRGEGDDEARPTVAHERQRDAGQRREPHDGGEVDRRLAEDEGRETGRESLPERVAAAQRDVEPRVAEEGEGADDGRCAEEAELLADDGEDHVGRGLREVVDLLDALAEPDAGEPAGAERDRRLHDLEARSLRVAPRVEEAEEPGAPVGLDPDGGEGEEAEERPGPGEEPHRHAGDDEHRADHDHDGDDGAEVGLDEDQRAGGPDDDPERPEELAERARRASPREHGRHPERECELRQLGRLEVEEAEGEPAPRAVHRRSDREHGEEEEEGDDEERAARVAKRPEVEARADDEGDEPEQRVGGLALEVVRGIALADDGTLYVADTWNMRIQGFRDSTPGQFDPVFEWTIEGWYGQGLENKPYLDVSGDGQVCASDSEGYRILCFTSEGDFVVGWGAFGTLETQFNFPSGVAFDSENRLWVVDSGNNRLMRFTPDFGD